LIEEHLGAMVRPISIIDFKKMMRGMSSSPRPAIAFRCSMSVSVTGSSRPAFAEITSSMDALPVLRRAAL
jgi:hypothetical protein